MTIPADQYVLRDVTDPHGTVRVLRDYWWWCVDGDPRKAVFYLAHGRLGRLGAPQCNSDRRVTERVPVSLPDAVMCQIPIAFVPVEVAHD